VLICEGRNRVVRRLFEKVGHPVMKLRRTKYGPFRLGKLDVGQTRVLTMKEYQQARRTVMSQGEGDGDTRRSFKSEHSRGPSKEKFSREERPNRAGPFSKERRGSSKRPGNQGRKPTARRRRG
jgi:23S rRNA pseudouridine2605 synthase